MRFAHTFATIMLLVSPTLGVTPGQGPSSERGCSRALDAVLSNDVVTIRKIAGASVASQDACDASQRTVLHYAAMYGSSEALALLVASGHFDVNAKDRFGGTALLYAAYDPTKVDTLLHNGANVNISSADGMSPLMVASSVHDSLSSIRALTSAGAKVNAVNSGGTDALMLAASNSDPAVVRMLLNSGADPKRVDNSGTSALMKALETTDPHNALILLHAGAPTNGSLSDAGTVAHGHIRLRGLTPLMMAAPYANSLVLKAMLARGAEVNARDMRGMTPLMLAVATAHANPENVRLLLHAGADPQAIDYAGRSVADWAKTTPNPIVLSLLKASYLPGRSDISRFINTPPVDEEVIMKSARALAIASTKFSGSGDTCIGCHTQAPVASAYATLLESRLKPPQEMVSTFAKDLSSLAVGYEPTLAQMEGPPGDFDLPLILLNTLADLGVPPSPLTNALVHYVALRQEASGAWNIGAFARPPLQDGAIVRTALGIRALSRYAIPSQRQDYDKRIALAMQWLAKARPVTTFELAEKLLTISSQPGHEGQAQLLSKALENRQHPDGGWSPISAMPADAFSTGIAMLALEKAAATSGLSVPLRRGTVFLTRTQQADGTWHVKSAAPKVQPYFESGFPYGTDQWISTIGTTFATEALALQRPHDKSILGAQVTPFFSFAQDVESGDRQAAK